MALSNAQIDRLVRNVKIVARQQRIDLRQSGATIELSDYKGKEYRLSLLGSSQVRSSSRSR